jgi:hypothetical protein
MKKATLFTISFCLFVANCTWVGTSKKIRLFDKEDKINIDSSFYLNYPKDGFQKTYFTKKLETNFDSAKEVVAVLRDKLSETFGQLTINERNLKLEEALAEASMKKNQYLIDIEIAQWKNASYLLCAPSQSKFSQYSEPETMDTVDLTIYIYDTKSKKLLNKQVIDNRGCPIVLLGIIPIGKNSPSSRFSSMIEEWLKNIK